MNQSVFGKTMENVCEKTDTYQTCNKRRKNELFSIRTKILCSKFFFWRLVYIKTENIYVDIAKDIEKITDASNYELDEP